MENESLLSRLVQSVSTFVQPHTVESTENHEDDIIDNELENECDKINMNLAMEAIINIAFECLDNLVYLEHHFDFLDHLLQILDAKGISKYRSLIFGLSGAPKIKEAPKDTDVKYHDIDGSFLEAVPLSGPGKEEAYTFLLRGEPSASKELLIDIMNNAKINNNTDSNFDYGLHYTTTTISKDNKKHARMPCPEEKTAISMLSKSFSGKLLQFQN